MQIKRFSKKRKHMFQVIFTNYLLCILAFILIAVTITSYYVYRFMVQQTGESRVDVLEQISDSNTVNRMNMVNVMNMVYEDVYDQLAAPPADAVNAEIDRKMDDIKNLLSRLGMDYTVDIQMNDKRSFSTDMDEDNLKTLKSSYWYIKHYSGEIDISWNLRFLDVDDITSYGLSYGKTVYGEDGTVLGVIIITAAHEALFRTFQQLVQNGAKVYILDQNGIIISSSNPGRIGNWMANMAAFEKTYGYNSYSMIERDGEAVIMSNYRDTNSGWTFIEEQSMESLLRESLAVLWKCVMLIGTISIVVSVMAYISVRRTTKIIADLSRQIGEMPADDLTCLPVQDAYEETYTLSTKFNGMIGRIQDLIQDIQLREQEKQKTEYDFLHAQINPHFLNNTLIAVKSLIAMGEVSRASRMMSELVELLHIPSTSEIQFVTLKEELHLVKNYISIMNCRTDKKVEFQCNIPDGMLENPVPRMILQPIVGNSIFHGFAEKTTDCRICVTAGYRGDTMWITVTDNGAGMAPERLEEVRSGNYQSDKTHHGIGLKNIRKRLQIIYGGGSGLQIRSVQGEFTAMTVTLEHYQSKQVWNPAGISKEETYESIGR